MFTIQYVHPVTRTSAMQEVDTKTTKRLLECLAGFEHEILAVYEQSTPVTKRTRMQLASMPHLSRAAKDFVMQGVRLTTPA